MPFKQYHLHYQHQDQSGHLEDLGSVPFGDTYGDKWQWQSLPVSSTVSSVPHPKLNRHYINANLRDKYYNLAKNIISHKSSSTSYFDLFSDLIEVPFSKDQPSQEEKEHSQQHRHHRHWQEPGIPLFLCKRTHLCSMQFYLFRSLCY